MEKFAIITAGGMGKRMKSRIPKQFLPLGNLPLLMHSIKKFNQLIDEINIIITLPETHLNYWNELITQYDFNVAHKIVKGGETRFHSVKNALDSINTTNGLVAIHDGARPLFSLTLCERLFVTGLNSGNAVPAIKLKDSLRFYGGDKWEAVDRDLYRIIQTPQVFKLDCIKPAYDVPYSEEFTDDASLIDAYGLEVNLVKGENTNIKITTHADYVLAQYLHSLSVETEK